MSGGRGCMSGGKGACQVVRDACQVVGGACQVGVHILSWQRELHAASVPPLTLKPSSVHGIGTISRLHCQQSFCNETTRSAASHPPTCIL